MATNSEPSEMKQKKNKWLNRNIFAMGLTSFFSDFGHEMATAILPAFLVSVGGSAATEMKTRDVRMFIIGGGTAQMMRKIIGRSIVERGTGCWD